MKFTLLLYGDESQGADATPEDLAATMASFEAFDRELTAAGVLAGGEELDHTSTATTVRVRDGERLVTDGPFAELKEALGGYFVLECESMDEACRWAAKIPGAHHGAVEVRPLHVEEAA